MDRISNLPDEILSHIGYFLSAKEAVFTTVLSKRWRNLFTIIPKLHFEGSINDVEGFKAFVDEVLALPKTCRVREFSLKWHAHHDHHHDDFNKCLLHVLKLGVLVLDLRIKGKDEEEEGYNYSLPFEVFNCETVVDLSLGYGFAIENLPNNAFLPSLKTLFLYKVRFLSIGHCVFNKLLDACPMLHDLTLCGVDWEKWKWSRTVSSSTLQRLTIIRKEWDSFDASDFKNVGFNTPSLVYLYYSDYVPKKYINVNLNSLVEAKLHLCPEENYLWDKTDVRRFNPMNLFHGLKHVEILDLYTIMSLQMFEVFRATLPVFEKLHHLSVNLSNFCWFPLSVLIKKSPNLKSLTINGPLHDGSLFCGVESTLCFCVSAYSFLSSCPLEILKITEYYGSLEELIQMKYVLKKLSCLERVEVHSQCSNEGKLKLVEDLQKLPKASSKCQIQVFSRFA